MAFLLLQIFPHTEKRDGLSTFVDTRKASGYLREIGSSSRQSSDDFVAIGRTFGGLRLRDHCQNCYLLNLKIRFDFVYSFV